MRNGHVEYTVEKNCVHIFLAKRNQLRNYEKERHMRTIPSSKSYQTFIGE